MGRFLEIGTLDTSAYRSLGASTGIGTPSGEKRGHQSESCENKMAGKYPNGKP